MEIHLTVGEIKTIRKALKEAIREYETRNAVDDLGTKLESRARHPSRSPETLTKYLEEKHTLEEKDNG
jgi:hypothetical protein